MMMEGKTPPSEARTMPGGAKNTPKKRGGAIKKRKKYNSLKRPQKFSCKGSSYSGNYFSEKVKR